MAFFDQVARPSRLVLGKKFFHIWFIYTREGCILVLHLFFLQSVIYETPYCPVQSVQSFVLLRMPGIIIKADITRACEIIHQINCLADHALILPS